MLKLRTFLRAWLLGTWEPPAGVRASVAIARDGMIVVLLAAEAAGVRGGVTVPPESPVWFNPSVFEALDFMASRMLDAAAGRSGTGDLRIATAMEAAGEAFADGIERATRTPIPTPISEDDR
jgi:hypothetical protein